MFISEPFKQDTLSGNTKITPLVILERTTQYYEVDPPYEDSYTYYHVEPLGFSTSPMTLIEPAPVFGVADPEIKFKPLLLGLPKIKETIDPVTKKYRISSVTINLSDDRYMGEKLTDRLFNPNLYPFSTLINETVSIYLHSPSCSTITPAERNVNLSLRDKDCPRIYTGKIRKINLRENKIQIKLEDISQGKLLTEVPINRMGDGSDTPNKYKNKPIPMTYGRLEHAPVVGKWKDGHLNFKADSVPIKSVINGYWFYNDDAGHGVAPFTGYMHGAISTYEDNYIKILQEVQHQFITNFWEDASNGIINEEYVEITDANSQQYFVNADDSITVYTHGLWNKKRVQGIYEGPPETISIVRTGSNSSFYNEELVTEENYRLMTDGEDGTFAEIEDEVIDTNFEIEGWQDQAQINFSYRISWETKIGAAKFSKLLKAKINGKRLPVPQDGTFTSGYGHWIENQFSLFSIPPMFTSIGLHDIDPTFWSDCNMTGIVTNNDSLNLWEIPDHWSFHMYQPAKYEDLPDLFSMSANHGNEEGNNPGSFNTDGLNVAPQDFELDWNDDAQIKFRTRFNDDQSSDDFTTDCIPFLRFHEGTYSWDPLKVADSHYCIDILTAAFSDYNPNLITSSYDFIFYAKIWDVYVGSIVELDDAHEKDYFANVEGRVDNDLNGNAMLKNPIMIIRNIAGMELGISQFDAGEYNDAVEAHSDWEFAFSVTEAIEGKKLIEDICKSTKSFPRIKNNGKFGFVTIKDSYGEDDWNDAVVIKKHDVINYKFSMDDPKDIISELDLEYEYDYGENSYLKSIKSNYKIDDQTAIMDEYALHWNAIESPTNNKKTIKSKYIRDNGTAMRLRKFLWDQRRAAHLYIELDLPLMYSELEVGSILRIDEKFTESKPFGIDYTNPWQMGMVLRYPLFLVTEVQRSLDSISIKCKQLHLLLGGYYGEFKPDLADPSGFFVHDNFPRGNFHGDGGPGDPAYLNPNIDSGDLIVTQPGTSTQPLQLEDQISYVLSNADNSFTFRFTDIGIRYNHADIPLQYIMATTFDEPMFGVDDFNTNLIPEQQIATGYGDLLYGPELNQSGGFIAIEIRMESRNGERYILALRNVADTVFDSLSFSTIIPEQITPHNTELRLDWVLHHSDSNWNYGNCYNAGLNVMVMSYNPIVSNEAWAKANLLLPIREWSETDSGVTMINQKEFTYTMTLYPYFNPQPLHALQWGCPWEGYIGTEPPAMGVAPDSFQDGVWDILDIVTTANMIIDNEYHDDADQNSDGIIDVLDVVILINLILGNE